MAFEDMREYAVRHGTWEESKEEPDIEELVNIHMSESMPVPKCRDAKRFVEHLDEIADLKLNSNFTN